MIEARGEKLKWPTLKVHCRGDDSAVYFQKAIVQRRREISRDRPVNEFPWKRTKRVSEVKQVLTHRREPTGDKYSRMSVWRPTWMSPEGKKREKAKKKDTFRWTSDSQEKENWEQRGSSLVTGNNCTAQFEDILREFKATARSVDTLSGLFYRIPWTNKLLRNKGTRRLLTVIPRVNGKTRTTRASR